MSTEPKPRAPRSRVLGVDFFAGSLDEALAEAARGGLLTAPAGIGLAEDLLREPAYRRALSRSEIVLTDSGFLVLLWRGRGGEALPRHSGLKFLQHWLKRPEIKTPGTIAWVMPNAREVELARTWLVSVGIPVREEDFYVAPWYGAGEIEDLALLEWLERRRPATVYLGIGGGTQERLGLFLRERLSYGPTILCLGAALAFLTGAQVGIPPWVDRARLGWLWRVASQPRRYGGRYLRAVVLARHVIQFGRVSPPLRNSTQTWKVT